MLHGRLSRRKECPVGGGGGQWGSRVGIWVVWYGMAEDSWRDPNQIVEEDIMENICSMLDVRYCAVL